MSASLAPESDDLARAYRVSDAAGAGRLSADAVLAGSAGITVLGRSTATDGVEHLILVELSGAGETVAVRHYPSDLGTARAVAHAPDGALVIAGEAHRGPQDYRGSLLRLDAGGEVVHSAVFGPSGASGFSAVSVLPDDTTVAGGATRGHGWLVRASAVAQPRGELPLDDVAEVTGLTSFDGGLAMVAVRDRSTTALGTARVASLADDGRIRWQRQLPANGRGELAAVATRSGGGLVAVGHYEPVPPSGAGPTAPARLWLLRLNAAGEHSWEQSIGAGGGQWRGRAIAALPDGGLAAAGDVGYDGRRELRAMRLAADGSVLWARRYGGEYDVASGITASGDGGLVLVGTTAAPDLARTDIRVLRLDQAGNVRWERVFGAAGTDRTAAGRSLYGVDDVVADVLQVAAELYRNDPGR
jgi:hypothetical protein